MKRLDVIRVIHKIHGQAVSQRCESLLPGEEVLDWGTVEKAIIHARQIEAQAALRYCEYLSSLQCNS